MIDNYLKIATQLRMIITQTNDKTLTGISEQHEQNIGKSKIFTITEPITTLLAKTDNDFLIKKFPFPIIFLDVNIDLDENNCIKGILAIEESTDSPQRLTCFVEKNKSGFYGSYDIGYEEPIQETITRKWREDFKDKPEFIALNDPYKLFEEGFGDEIKSFFNNFLDFLNTPDVQIIEVLRTENQNAKRIERNQVPIPSHNYIRLNGQLKIYANKLESQGLYKIGHKFWVRGHWRTLRREDRYGSNTGRKIWILPYIKGQGILIEKSYIVKQSDHLSG